MSNDVWQLIIRYDNGTTKIEEFSSKQERKGRRNHLSGKRRELGIFKLENNKVSRKGASGVACL